MSQQTLYEVEVPVTLLEESLIECDGKSTTLCVWVKEVNTPSKQEAIEVIKKIPEQRLLSMLVVQLEEQLKNFNQDNHFGIKYIKQCIKAVKEKKCRVGTPTIKDVYEMDQDSIDDMKKKISKHVEEE